MLCPECGSKLRPNKGWAAQFYDGYCNQCDMPVADGIPEDEEVYTCEYCGHSMKWDESDDEHGDLWSCEVVGCGKVFCTKCFVARHGYQKWRKMMVDGSDIICCPDHYEAHYEGGAKE